MAHQLAVVCAWCNRVVTKAPPGAGVTHTICPPCVNWTLTHPTSQAGPGATSDLEAPRLPAGYFGDDH